MSENNADPRGNVVELLERIRDAFAPKVAHALLSGLTRRVELDSRIVPEAKER